MFRTRWHSLGAAFLLILLSLPLGGGCSSNDPAVKIYTASDEGITECKADHPDQAGQCEQALSGSRVEHDTTAPHLSLDQCIATYGEAACISRDNGSYYVPAMAGFMFGAMVGSGVSYHPVYVNSWGQAYYGPTMLGTYRPGVHVYITPAPNSVWVKQYRYTTVSIPANTPTAAPAFSKSPTGAPVIQRGGTGGSAATMAAPRAPPAAGSPPAGAIQRGGTGSAASVAAPPKPEPAAAAPPGAHIERGGTGGAAAVTRAAAPPPAAAAPPERHYGQPDRAPSSIQRGNTGGGSSMGSTRSSTSSPSSSGKR